MRLAPSMNSATAAAISSAGWPPSVRVRIVISGFIERLVDARIGATFNFYRDGERAALLRGRLEAYLESRIEAPLLLVAEAPGYRGARISGVPLTSERQLTGEGPAEATATIVHAALGELGLSDRVLLWNVVPTHPGDAALEPAAEPRRDRRRAAFRPGARPRTAGRRRRQDRARRFRRRLHQASRTRRSDRLPPWACSRWYHRLSADPVRAHELALGNLAMKTYSAKPGEITRDWYVVDADGQTLGRLATQIADRLRGKGKPQFTPHVDTGDFVVVVNAEKIAVTGKKLEDKMYYRHSGYPGGLKVRPLREQLERRPTEVLRKAVKGMLPKNKLSRHQLTKLKIYAGPEHPHTAQEPKPF